MISHRTILRPPRPTDAPGLHRLIAACPPLDCNSAYAYLVICRDFAATSVVATAGGSLIGALTGYRRPDRPDTLFVWQVAVAPEQRGRGLARRMLNEVLDRPTQRQVAWIETTIGPGNAASQALFAGFAASRGLRIETSLLCAGELLGDGHEPEVLHRVGPLAWGAVREAV
jgi:L-2,4-diaminobutyric acid acetyltransferase